MEGTGEKMEGIDVAHDVTLDQVEQQPLPDSQAANVEGTATPALSANGEQQQQALAEEDLPWTSEGAEKANHLGLRAHLINVREYKKAKNQDLEGGAIGKVTPHQMRLKELFRYITKRIEKKIREREGLILDQQEEEQKIKLPQRASGGFNFRFGGGGSSGGTPEPPPARGGGGGGGGGLRSRTWSGRRLLSFEEGDGPADRRVLHRLTYRDVRQLCETFYPNSRPGLQVRNGAVVAIMGQFRACVLPDRLLVVLPQGADGVLEQLERKLYAPWTAEREAGQAEMPFELRAIETIISLATSRMGKLVDDLYAEVGDLIKAVGGKGALSAEVHDRLRALKDRAGPLGTRLRSYQEALQDSLEDDEDLALMSLTKIQANPLRYRLPLSLEALEDHEDAELLLEAYLQEFGTSYNRLEILQSKLENAESLVLMKLDVARNKLLTASTIFALVSMCTGFGSFFGSIMGMNLPNTHEDDYNWFKGVAAASVLFSAGVGAITYGYFAFKGVLVS